MSLKKEASGERDASFGHANLSLVGRILDFFVVGSAIGDGENTNIPGNERLWGILFAVAIVIIFLGFLYLAWRRPLLIGILLVLIGAAVTGAYLFTDRSNMMLLINGPPLLISGILFLLSRQRRQSV